MSYLGFCGTMGADYIDYIIADNVVLPKELRVFYQEKVLAMPHSYFVNDHRQSSKQLVDLPTGSLLILILLLLPSSLLSSLSSSSFSLSSLPPSHPNCRCVS